MNSLNPDEKISDVESIDDDRDIDLMPNSELIESESDSVDNNNDEIDPHALNTRKENLSENIEFASDLSLSPIVKSKSNSDVELWKRYGVLMKAGTIVKGLSDRIYCSLCFENKVLKRLAFIVRSSIGIM